MNSSMTPAVQLERVSKNFGSVQALQNVSFKVQPGEVVAVLGPNGAGKTTAISLMLGLRSPSSGSARIFGRDPREAANRARIGTMLQDSDVPATLRVREVVELVGMALSYATALILWPIIGSGGIGLLVYAGSFAGFQMSVLPAAFSIAVSVAAALGLTVFGGADVSVMFIPVFTTVAAIGNQLAFREIIANRQLRRSQQEVVQIARIAERERIARDLHDLLGHTLSVIVLKSELASRLAEKNPERAIQEIRDVERIARESLQEVRSAVRGYRSTGLEGELANVSLALEAAQIRLETLIAPLELEWIVEQTLAFVLREAVTNAIRHANARALWVNLERSGENARLSVRDDGAGRITDGNGLRGMRERLEAQGGRLEIDADGKRLSALLPLLVRAEAQVAPSPLKLEGAP